MRAYLRWLLKEEPFSVVMILLILLGILELSWLQPWG